MMNLESLSAPRSTRKIKWLAIALLVVSFVGFVDATYLATKFYLGTPITCPIFGGCEKVIASPYAHIGPFPISLFGMLYYLMVFLAIVFYFDTQSEQVLLLTSYFTTIGFLVSLGLVYLQIFVIGAICFYCMISAVTSTILFLLGISIVRLSKVDS